MFSYEDLVVDPYWDDLYDPKKNKQRKNNED